MIDDDALIAERLRNERILVTGASGLVGQELVRQLLLLDVPVRGVDRAPSAVTDPRFEFLSGDLRDPAVVREATRDRSVILHAAATQYHDGVHAWRRRTRFAENVATCRALLLAAFDQPARAFVLWSSDMVYGIPRQRPFAERDRTRPIGPYGASKVACERMTREARARGLRTAILRPRLIVGPGRLGVLRRLFDRMLAGRPIPLFGCGSNRYQMVGVGDVSRAALSVVARDISGTYNLGSADPPTVRELLSEVGRRAGIPVRFRPLPRRPTEWLLRIADAVGLSPLAAEQFRIAGRDYVLDCRRAAAELGWTPRQSDAEMLSQALEEYRQSRDPRSGERSARLTVIPPPLPSQVLSAEPWSTTPLEPPA